MKQYSETPTILKEWTTQTKETDEYYSWVKVNEKGEVIFGSEQGNYCGGPLITPEFYSNFRYYEEAVRHYLSVYQKSWPKIYLELTNFLKEKGFLERYFVPQPKPTPEEAIDEAKYILESLEVQLYSTIEQLKKQDEHFCIDKINCILDVLKELKEKKVDKDI